jgi:hypothetical protein
LMKKRTKSDQNSKILMCTQYQRTWGGVQNLLKCKIKKSKILR